MMAWNQKLFHMGCVNIASYTVAGVNYLTYLTHVKYLRLEQNIPNKLFHVKCKVTLVVCFGVSTCMGY